MTLFHDDSEYHIYSGLQMSARRISASWLSEDMAHALAATCPPLQVEDVPRAADKLSEHAAIPGVVVADCMFRSDVNRVNLLNVFGVLNALHDMGRESLDSQSGQCGDDR
jgi:hypothetical protein